MFQRAAPELNGFGVTTSTSLLSTSSKLFSPSGLPLRTVSTTTEFWPIPLYLFWFQFFGTSSPSSTSRSMSPPWAKWTIEAG